jgi:hypothetical protein
MRKRQRSNEGRSSAGASGVKQEGRRAREERLRGEWREKVREREQGEVSSSRVLLV